MPVETFGILLSVLTPLVAVPLTVITFYLRSLREHQLTRHHELAVRVDEYGRALDALRDRVSDFERDYATKEEWLRECLHARRVLDRLSAASVRLETVVEASGVCGKQFGGSGSRADGTADECPTVEPTRREV